MEVLTWPIEKLMFYARNPRRNDTVVDPLSASIMPYSLSAVRMIRLVAE